MAGVHEMNIEERTNKIYMEAVRQFDAYTANPSEFLPERRAQEISLLVTEALQAERDDMREESVKWCELQSELADAVVGNRHAKMLAEERSITYAQCAEEIRALK